jgi:hypothetical protein
MEKNKTGVKGARQLKGPFPGDVRTVTKFLFLPKRLQGKIRWLKIVDIQQIYKLNPKSLGEGSVSLLGWVDYKYVK